MINWIALVVAIVLSSVAAYFSILGLIAIFAASAFAVGVMAFTLEVAKVVTTIWLHLTWKEISKTIKVYLTFAVFVLMFITSMGIFGFLSKAHIEQNVKITEAADTNLLDFKIKTVEKEIELIDKRIDIMDSVVNQLINTKQPKTAERTITKNKPERDKLEKERLEKTEELTKLKAERSKIDTEVMKLEAEVGPIKYVAQIFGEADKNLLEKVVTWMIIVIVVVFDPLAIALVNGAAKGLQKQAEEKKKAVVVQEEVKPEQPKTEETVVTIAEPEAFEEAVITPSRALRAKKKVNASANVASIPNRAMHLKGRKKKNGTYVTIPKDAIVRL